MDIFIDTSVVYTDPFWKRNIPGRILKAAMDGRINIYIANVVIRELRHNFEKQLDKEFTSVISSNSNIKKLSRKHIDIIVPTKEQYLNDFDNFYNDHCKLKNIVELPTEKNILEELLERAIKRKKPFNDNRSEFKDAVIWTTYFKYAKSKGLTDCHLLTNNKKDFTDNEGNLHQELGNDYDKFTVHLTFDDFYKAKKDYFEKPIFEFQEWINQKKLDENVVFDLLGDNEVDKVYSEVQSRFENIDPSNFVSERETINVLGGYVDIGEVEWRECDDIEVDVIGEQAIISGILLLRVSLELYGYNSVRDLGNEKFPHYSSVDQDVKVFFNFLFDRDQVPKNFEVTDVEQENQ